MIKEVEGLNHWIAISGVRNFQEKDVTELVNTLQEIAGTKVQIFDADSIAGWQHLFFAALNALVAFKNKTNTTRSLGVETILFASTQRQISKAFKMVGLRSESKHIAILTIDETKKGAVTKLNECLKAISGDIDDDILMLNDMKFNRIKELFKISDLEINAKLENEEEKREVLIDLVIENVALLAIRR